MSNLDLAKAAAANAIATCTSDNPTWKKSYLQPTSEMIQSALFTVIEEFTRIRDAREKVLLDKIDELNKKIESRPPPSTGISPKTSFSELAAAFTKPGSQTNLALIRAVSTNAKITENKAKNVVFINIPLPNGEDQVAREKADTEAVTKILNDIHINQKIVSIRRINPRPQAARAGPPSSTAAEGASTSVSTTPATTTAAAGVAAPQQPPPLIVEFETVAIRNDIIAAARSLASSDHKDIYIRPDRTIAEQVEFNRLNEEKKIANKDLEKVGNLDKPFRFVIRGDRVRCVDVTKTLEINGRVKNPFVDTKTAQKARTTPNTTETAAAH